jgi:hypothetical protein
MKKDFALRSDNLHLNRRAATPAFALRFDCKRQFRPIALETVGGTWIEIEHEADIFIYDRMKTTSVVAFDPEGRKFIFEPEQISAIEPR